MRLYLDLDGVFADLESYLHSKSGLKYDNDPVKAWGVLDKIPNMFAELPTMPFALELFDTIWVNRQVETQILTALPILTGCLTTAAEDKRAWCRKHLHKEIAVNVVDSWRDKSVFANGSILLDDSPRNIAAWNDAYRDSRGLGVYHCNNVNSIIELMKLEVISANSLDFYNDLIGEN